MLPIVEQELYNDKAMEGGVSEGSGSGGTKASREQPVAGEVAGSKQSHQPSVLGGISDSVLAALCVCVPLCCSCCPLL